jgi:hypothetical protein
MDRLSSSGKTGDDGMFAAAEIVHSIYPHWPGNVLYLLLAHILEDIIKPVAHLVTHDPAKADPAGLGERLQTRRDIHPMPEDVVLLNNDIAEIDPDAKRDALIFGRFGVALSYPPLQLDGTTHRIDYACKLGQEAVASVLYDPAPVLRDLRINDLPEVAFEPFVRPLLIRAHEARVPRHIGGEDRGETADRGHGLPGGRGWLNPSLP